LLDAIDFGASLPSGEAQSDIPLKSWKDTVSKEVDCEKNSFNKGAYSELYLPIRMVGKWLLLVCAPGERVTHTIVFDRWDWEHPDFIKVLEMVADQIKRLVLNQGLTLRASKKTEKDTAWPMMRDDKHKNKYGVTRYVMNLFFSPSDKLEEVRPLDRLLACWSLLLQSPFPAAVELNNIKSTWRKD
jgi:hypothetical protein